MEIFLSTQSDGEKEESLVILDPASWNSFKKKKKVEIIWTYSAYISPGLMGLNFGEGKKIVDIGNTWYPGSVRIIGDEKSQIRNVLWNIHQHHITNPSPQQAEPSFVSQSDIS